MNGKRFIVSGAAPAVFAPLEHEEGGTQNLVADGDDGALVTARTTSDWNFDLNADLVRLTA